MVFVEPAGHAYPAVQLPLHATVAMAAEAPKSPAGHGEHAPAPARLYRPAAQIAAVALVDPAGHAYPSEHGPLHAAVVRPATDPNVPAGHGAVQAAVGSPRVSPYKPALQLLQVPAPRTLNFPTTQMAAVGLVDPATHAYPAVQLPLHEALGRPAVAPKVPEGQSVQTAAPARLYRPAAQIATVGLLLPAGQAYPAEHGPVQEEEFKAVPEPKRPGPHHVHVAAPAVLNCPGPHAARQVGWAAPEPP